MLIEDIDLITLTIYYKYLLDVEVNMQEGPFPSILVLEYTNRDVSTFHQHYQYLKQHKEIETIVLDDCSATADFYIDINDPNIDRLEIDEEKTIIYDEKTFVWFDPEVSLYPNFLVARNGVVTYTTYGEDGNEEVWAEVLQLKDNYQTEFKGLEL